jgi:DNA-binding transcriptional LysR family regulator
MLVYARRLIELRNQMQRALQAFTELAIGSIRMAAHESAVEYLLPAPLTAFHERHPDIKIVTRLCNVDEIAGLVSSREVDLGFGIRQPNLRGLCSEVVHHDPVVLVTAPEHRLTRAGAVELRDLSTERFFVHHLHTSTTDMIQQLFEEQRARFNVVAELWNFETVKRFVRAGSGVAVILLSVAQPDLDAGRLSRVLVLDLKVSRTIEVVYRERGQMLPAPAEFLEMLRQWSWGGNVQVDADSGPANTIAAGESWRSARARSRARVSDGV